MTRNGFATLLRQERGTVGIWSLIGDPMVSELLASAGFDWMLFDMEHSAAEVRDVVSVLQAASAHPTPVVVRPPHGDEVTIKRLLDAGAKTLLVPMVDTVEQAQRLAAAVQFPPVGVRGVASQTRGGAWGRDPRYLHTAREEICLIVQIESREAAENAAGIAAVEGVDAVFVGTADLAASMGHLGDAGHPEVVAAVDRIADAVARAGKPLGTLTRDIAAAHRYLANGYSFVGVGTDTALLVDALSRLRQAFPTA